jgi:predicted Zn-dependent peptidase
MACDDEERRLAPDFNTRQGNSVEKVTKEDVLRVAKKHLQPGELAPSCRRSETRTAPSWPSPLARKGRGCL